VRTRGSAHRSRRIPYIGKVGGIGRKRLFHPTQREFKGIRIAADKGIGVECRWQPTPPEVCYAMTFLLFLVRWASWNTSSAAPRDRKTGGQVLGKRRAEDRAAESTLASPRVTRLGQALDQCGLGHRLIRRQ